MLDIHTHILPGVDDGSRSVEQSLEMLALQKQQGVDTVALTPHFLANRESPTEFLTRRNAAEKELRAAMEGRTDMPRILLGAEAAFFDGMCRADEIDLLCLGDTRAMLIEMPFCKWNRRMLSELEEILHIRRIQPILAHIERYLSFQESDIVDQLIDSGMWIQVNTSFFLQWQTSRRAMRLLKEQGIHFVASDSHDLKTRVPNLGQAVAKIEKKLGEEAIDFLRYREKRLLGG